MRRIALIVQVLAIGLVSLLAAPPYAAAAEEVITVKPGEAVEVHLPGTTPNPTEAPTVTPPEAQPPAESHTSSTPPANIEVHVEQRHVTPASVLQPGDVEKQGTAAAKELTEIAQEYWGYEPNCSGGYKVLVNAITDQPKDPDGTGTEAAGEAAVPGCFMRIIPSYWVESLTPGEQTEDTCAVFVHEYGHSLGHPHTTNPDSVMNPHTMYAEGMPSECKELAEAEPNPEPEAAATKTKKHHRKHHARRRRLHRKIKRAHKITSGEEDATGARGLELVPYLPGLLPA